MFKVCISKELILMDEFSVLKMQKKKKNYDSNSAIKGLK